MASLAAVLLTPPRMDATDVDRGRMPASVKRLRALTERERQGAADDQAHCQLHAALPAKGIYDQCLKVLFNYLRVDLNSASATAGKRQSQ